jgi:Ca2+-binding EF-hand superfamily protein
MKMKTSLAAAFLAFAGAATAAGGAAAQQGPGAANQAPRAPGQRFERLDTDDSGSISFEEFAAAMGGRMDAADADGNGTLTVEEVAAQLQKEHFRRQAQRMIRRLDANGDGQLTTAEIESRQKKMYALMDRDDSGAIEADEMRRGNREGRRGGGRHNR